MRQPCTIRKILDPSEALVVADNATRPDVTLYIDSSGISRTLQDSTTWRNGLHQSQGLSTNCCSFILYPRELLLNCSAVTDSLRGEAATRNGQNRLVVCRSDEPLHLSRPSEWGLCRECPECQSRESCRSHTASVSPADVRSDPINSLTVEEILKTLGISVGSQPWRNTKKNRRCVCGLRQSTVCLSEQGGAVTPTARRLVNKMRSTNSAISARGVAPQRGAVRGLAVGLPVAKLWTFWEPSETL